MNRHQFLEYDLKSSVSLSSAEKKKLVDYLRLSSLVFEHLQRKGHLPKKLKKIQLSILICGDKKIKSLNLHFRQKNKVTDVLSFPSHENLRESDNYPVYQDNTLFLGDLAICFPQAKRQAKKFNIGIWDEFIHLFFHGSLHLLGFDHEISQEEEVIMQKLEDWCLELFSKKKGARSSPKI